MINLAGTSLSRNGRLLLQQLAGYEPSAALGYEAAGWVSEIPLHELARRLGITVDETAVAAGELVAAGRPGISIGGLDLVLRA